MSTNEPSERMTRQAWYALPLALRNKPGRSDTPLVQIGLLDVPVTFVCVHDVPERINCLDCQREGI